MLLVPENLRELVPENLRELVPEGILNPLGPGSPNESLRPKVVALKPKSLFGDQNVVDESAARCCLSGLWLLHNFLEESHTISQEIETADGSYWHGIMHRREPDYGNAKYWFRRVGNHPVFVLLAVKARDLAFTGQEKLPAAAQFLIGQESWDPYRFIDWCEALACGSAQYNDEELLARRVARAEWDLLFEHCFRRATGAA